MTDDQSIEGRLQNERNIWLTTVRPDGRPHLIPIWFVYARSRFWIGTALASVKSRNIVANPCVSVALEDGMRPVVAEGTATIHERFRPPDVVEAFMTKYAWDMTELVDPDMGAIALVEIEPRCWLYGRPTGLSPSEG